MKLFRYIYYKCLENQRVAFFTFLLMLSLPNFIMFFTEQTSTFTRICNIVFPFAIYWLILTFSKKPGKIFWCLFFFIFLDAFEIVLLYLFGESPIAVDMFLNLVTTNVTEADELLSDLVPAVAFVIVIYVYGIVLAIYSTINKNTLNQLFRLNQRKFSAILAVIAVFMILINYVVDRDFKVSNDIFPINACYNLGLAIKGNIKSVNYLRASNDFSFHAVDTRPDTIPEIYVFVVGETARADNFGIYGYHRNTTPFLKTMKDIVFYRDAITMSNTTHKSVPLLLSAVASESYDSLYCQKGIFSAFNEAGYSTAFYSNQRRNRSYIDYMGSEADEKVFIKDNYPVIANVSDDKLLSLLNKRLDNFHKGKLFIILHCYGSHFNYYDRYPQSASYYDPDEIPSADKKYRSNIINAYDNTIRYTDQFLAKIISALKRQNVASAMIYTSDHGEDLFDDKRALFLHASPITSYYQLRVPLIVWTSQRYQQMFPDKWETLNNNRYKPVSTNLVIFHTILDMSGIKSPYFKPINAISSKYFKVSQRLYVNDHNEFKTLDHIGLKNLDVYEFKKHGLKYP